jgi:outer membrane protein TolC
MLVLLALASSALAAPLTLTDAIHLAATHAPDALAAGARADEARAVAAGATAALLPQINASGSYQHWDMEVSIPNFLDPTGSDIVIQAQESLNAQFTASQVVFAPGAFGRDLATHAAADAAEHQADATRADIAMRAASVWVGAWAAQETVTATEEARGTAQKRLDIARQALASGTLTQLGVDRAEIALHDAERKSLDAARLRDDLYAQLRLLTGVEIVEPLQAAAAGEGAPVVGTDVTELVAQGLGKRADIAAATAQLRAAKAGSWNVVGEWAPTVAANAALRASNSTGFTGEPTSWYVGVSANLPIFDGGLRVDDAKKVSAQREQAELALQRVTDNATEEIRSAVRGLSVARTSADVATQQASVARHAAQLTASAYDAGTATQVEVEDADSAVLDAEVGRIRAVGSLLLAQWQLARAVGGL